MQTPTLDRRIAELARKKAVLLSLPKSGRTGLPEVLKALHRLKNWRKELHAHPVEEAAQCIARGGGQHNIFVLAELDLQLRKIRDSKVTLPHSSSTHRAISKDDAITKLDVVSQAINDVRSRLDNIEQNLSKLGHYITLENVQQ